MIELKNLSIKYVKEYFSLYNINLEINENTLLLGDDSCGIFALFRIINKIDKDYDGNILIDNIDIKNIKDKDLNIAWVAREPYLFNNKSVFYNLYYPLKIRKFNKTEAKNIVNNAIVKYNLEKFPKKIKNMSVTQKKIITLVRALIRRPKYIMIENFYEYLDEHYLSLANNIISDAKNSSIIIASEKDENIPDIYSGFRQVRFDNGSIKND